MKTLLLLAGMSMAATAALAADPAQPVNIIFAADSATCTAWTKSASNPLIRKHYESWTRGFVSGHNYANPARQIKVGAFPGGDELYRYFDQYCRDNPQHTFVAGAIQLVEQLAAPAPSAKPAARLPAPAK